MNQNFTPSRVKNRKSVFDDESTDIQVLTPRKKLRKIPLEFLSNVPKVPKSSIEIQKISQTSTQNISI